MVESRDNELEVKVLNVREEFGGEAIHIKSSEEEEKVFPPKLAPPAQLQQ